MADLTKLFVLVPTGTTFVGATVSAADNKIYFEQSKCTIWHKGIAYGMDPDKVKGLEDVIALVGTKPTDWADADTVISKLEAEIARATKAESDLQDVIDAETLARETADKALDSSIAAEIERATDAEDALDKRIKDLEYEDRVSLADGEKILNLTTDKVLSTTLTVDIVSEGEGDAKTEYIVLKGKDNAEISKVNANRFVADGMLENAELIKKQEEGVTEEAPYIKFTWNVDAGSKIVRVSVKDFIDTYTVKEGSENYIGINNYEVEIKTSNIEETATGLAKAADVYTAVKDEADERKAADTALEYAIKDEEDRAKKAESDLQDAINAEVERAKEVEGYLDYRLDNAEVSIDLLESASTKHNASLIDHEGRIKVLEDFTGGLAVKAASQSELLNASVLPDKLTVSVTTTEKLNNAVDKIEGATVVGGNVGGVTIGGITYKYDDTDVNDRIADLSTYVGVIPEDAKSENVVGYVDEKLDDLTADLKKEEATVGTHVKVTYSEENGIVNISAVDASIATVTYTAATETTAAELSADQTTALLTGDAISKVKSYVDNRIDTLDSSVSDTDDNNYIKVTVEQENGKLSGVTVEFDPWETYEG